MITADVKEMFDEIFSVKIELMPFHLDQDSEILEAKSRL